MSTEKLSEHDHGVALSIPNAKAKEIAQTLLEERSKQPLTLQDVITRLLEKRIEAWKTLPFSVRKVMLERPQDFQFVDRGVCKENDFPFDIIYANMVWRCKSNSTYGIYEWILQDLLT